MIIFAVMFAIVVLWAMFVLFCYLVVPVLVIWWCEDRDNRLYRNGKDGENG